MNLLNKIAQNDHRSKVNRLLFVVDPDTAIITPVRHNDVTAQQRAEHFVYPTEYLAEQKQQELYHRTVYLVPDYISDTDELEESIRPSILGNIDDYDRQYNAVLYTKEAAYKVAFDNLKYSMQRSQEITDNAYNSVRKRLYKFEIEQWGEDVDNLNTRINNLPVWNDYAESLQREYDQLLSRRPKDIK